MFVQAFQVNPPGQKKKMEMGGPRVGQGEQREDVLQEDSCMLSSRNINESERKNALVLTICSFSSILY